MSSSRRVSAIFCILLVALAAALLFCALPTSTAHATSYYVGNGDLVVPLDYGAAPGEHILQEPESGYYFKITSYVVELNYVPTSLVTDGVVTALPGEYDLKVQDNTIQCDKDGNPLSANTFYGTIIVVVRENDLPITIGSASLTKEYGEERNTITWSCDDPHITDVLFTCAGFDASAPVGSYPVTVSTIMKGEEDVTDLYISSVTLDEGEGEVLFSVTPAPISFSIPEVATRPFNRYFLSDGESVLSAQAEGVNGETLTAYYRFKEAVNGVLTIGESYDVEPYRYEVSSGGETTSFTLDQSSDYAPTFLLENDHIVAGKGILTITQDQAVIAAHPNDLSYFYLPLTYDYLDAAVRRGLDHLQEYWATILYHGASIDLYFGADDAYKALPMQAPIPCGSYALTLVDYGKDVMETITAEGEMSLTVLKRSLSYAKNDDAEVASGDTFNKTVSVTFDGKRYDFILTADLSGRKVGDVLCYDSALSQTDENVTLDFSAATVTMIKRSTGVTIVSNVGSSVVYGDAYVPAALWLNKGKAGEMKLESETLNYAYSPDQSNLRTEGLPRNAGKYTIYCTLNSDTYQAAEKSIKLTIDKRPVAGYFVLITTSKVYGETFDFGDSNNVQLTTLYELDATKKAADRSKVITEYNKSMPFGSSLTSLGGGKDAAAGKYDFNFEGVLMENYKLRVAIYWDKGANRAVTQFTVEKADAPAPPKVTSSVSGATIRLSVSPLAAGRAELSLSSDFSEKKASDFSSGSVSFTSLTYGALYYVRVRSNDNANYNAPSVWTVEEITVPYPALSLTILEKTHDTVTVTAAPIENAVDGYTLQYRVGASGEWKEGAIAKELTPDRDYTLYFRAKNAYARGVDTPITVRTLRAPIEEDEISYRYDRELETLYFSSEVEGLECRLLSATGEYLTEWIAYSDLPALTKDANYTLEVRLAATEEREASGILSLSISTYEAPKPFSVKDFLSDWFLVLVGGGILLAALILLLVLIKAKRRADKEILGG